MSISYKVRDFSFPDDYKEVFDLWSNSGPGIQLRKSDQPEEIEKKLKRDADLFIVAEYENSIIGAVMGGYDGRRGIMYHLAVAHEFRNQGIASVLVDELERRLKSKGCIRYYLLVTKDNTQAIEFYEQRDWEKLDLFVYGKNLE
jgi:ribosomal protein S18 acetylase RimI-like enzyme